MNKININLLPKEIIEKRKTESRFVYFVFVFSALVIVLAVIYTVNFLRISAQTREIEQLKAENVRYEKAISEIQSYEVRKKELERRETLLATATSGEVTWSRFLNNVSLIVPNEIWLTSLQLNPESISFSASALASPDAAYKPVAKWLVHLAELKSLSEIQLSSLSKSEEELGGGVRLDFSSNAKFTSSKKSASEAPAPPTPSEGGSQQ